MRAVNLKTEYLSTPIGIDIHYPCLMWNCEEGVAQTAYQIITENWDSGKVESSSMHAVYPKELVDRERVNWKVRLWDENGNAGEWNASYFEMGISKWDAKWLTGNYNVNKRKRYPVDCFRKCFTVGEVFKARLYVTACGLYEGQLNGKRIGNFVLAPGYTDYTKRIQYQTYEVTDLIKNGENDISFMLADGWYRGSVGAWGIRNQYGKETKFLCQLEMEYTDGRRELIISDENWDWSNDGSIRFADNKDGEVVDARLKPSYSGKARLTSCAVVPVASNNVPIIEHEVLKPAIIRTPSGKTVLDFGQNIAGYISFSVDAHAGQRIFLRCGEMLDADGEFTQKNIQTASKRRISPLQQIEYICAEGKNEYKTRFAIFGFQYVLIETEVPFIPGDFCAIAVYSDIESTLEFSSSNRLLDKFVENTRWSTKNNSADIPTDCPTRERHGWTGDAQLFFDTAGYLFDYASFSRKYVNDLYDWQRKNGLLPQIAPYGGTDFFMWTMNGSVGWSDAGIIIPYKFWKLYGDDFLLREHYEGMKKYAGFMIRRCGRWGGLYAKPLHIDRANRKYAVNCGQSYDEWAEPDDVVAFNWKHFVEPHPEVSTAYTSYVMKLMSEIADRLGKTEDATLYREYCEGCKRAYQALVRTEKFDLDTDRQARLVRPLHFGLLDAEQTAFAKQRLLKAMENYGWRVGTGFLSTPLILYVLADIDIEAAYRLLENEELPGWLSMPKNGASTIWEGWEGAKARNGISSLDHYSKGACLEWVFRVMCGINVIGENQFCVAPHPGGHFTYVSLSYRSIYGKVSVGWEKTGKGYSYDIRIPSGCEAELSLPGKDRLYIKAGEFHFED